MLFLLLCNILMLYGKVYNVKVQLDILTLISALEKRTSLGELRMAHNTTGQMPLIEDCTLQTPNPNIGEEIYSSKVNNWLKSLRSEMLGNSSSMQLMTNSNSQIHGDKELNGVPVPDSILKKRLLQSGM